MINRKPTYSFETYETRPDLPEEEVKSILLDQAKVMHARIMQAGATANDPNSHVSAFWDKLDLALPPNGRFYMVRDGEGTPIGCGAIRKLDDETAEMKHLYVHSDHRGQGLGRDLVLRRLDDARAMGFNTVVADTIAAFPEMPALYESLGFEQVAPTETSGTVNVAPHIAQFLIFFRLTL